MKKSIFELPDDKKEELGIYKTEPKPTLKDRFVELFRKGKEEGKKYLTLDELVCGYYNLFTKPMDERPLFKHKFTQRMRYYLKVYDVKFTDEEERLKRSEYVSRPFLIKHYWWNTYELVE